MFMKKRVKYYSLVVLDFVLLGISLVFSLLVRFDFIINGMSRKYIDFLYHNLVIFIGVKLILLFIFKMYKTLWRYASIYELVLVTTSLFIGNATLFTYNLLFIHVPRSVFVVSFFVDITLIGGSRLAYRVCQKYLSKEAIFSKGIKRVLIYGAGDTGAVIIKQLLINPKLNGRPVVLLDKNVYKVGKKLNGVPVISSNSDLSEVAKDYRIDEIIIAIKSVSTKELNQIYEECAKTGCKVKILPTISQMIDESVILKRIRDVNIEDLLGRDPINMSNPDVYDFIQNKSVLVTGGGGSIGSELCRQIALFKPERLIILDNYENNAYEIEQEIKADYPELELEVIIASVREKERIDEVFDVHKPNIVFHAAAHKHVPLMEAHPAEAIKNNVFGTLNVVECADKHGVERFVLISTDKAVNPTNIMGATKRIAEMIIQTYDLHSRTEFVAVRFGNVLGSNGSVIPLFKKQIEQGGPVTVTHPEINRYFMTIPEAVQLVLQAGAMAEGGEIFVLDMGEPVKIHDLARNMIRLSGFEPDIDIKIKFTGLRPGEKLYEELLMSEEGLKSTDNNKIFVAQPLYMDMAMLKREIEILARTVKVDSDKIKEYVQVMVPTYKMAE